MAYGIPRNLESQYNVLTVPNYVKNLVVTASPGTIHAAYTAPPGVEAWTVYRPSSEGVPQTPFKGKRVVTPLAEDTETTVAVSLTEGVVNGTEYVVRVFIRGELGFQTRVGGAVARVTPVAGIPLGEYETGSLVNVTRGGVNCSWRKVSGSYNGNAEIIPLMLETITGTWSVTSSTRPNISLNEGINTSWWERLDLREYLNGEYLAGFDRPGLIQPVSVPSCSYYGPGGDNVNGRQINHSSDHVFLPSITEMDGSVHQAGLAEGIRFEYFTSNQSRVPAGAQNYRLRTGYPYATTGVYGKVNANGEVLGYGAGYVGEMGTRPVICMQASTLISPAANADGSHDPL
ncbi:DUF6273 domain-containing protein [Anaerotruncus massiliensis (ex Togo et al. 2019)]|uniref:DUF6273 domain-containing protein n=1 Tax=Anaerotruncus massiliensis (ex Togo et al. 2019) TaxID=1673720 RepID=UPI0027BA403B|nr:DUF6273 domain-containing protein [Anaerotruncus massiliensis (ex Togo et al. 2019)]